MQYQISYCIKSIRFYSVLNWLSVSTGEQGRSVMLLPLVFLWLLFVGGTVGEVDDDEDETEFALVSSQTNRIASHGIFLFSNFLTLINWPKFTFSSQFQYVIEYPGSKNKKISSQGFRLDEQTNSHNLYKINESYLVMRVTLSISLREC